MKELVRGSLVPSEHIQQLRLYDCRLYDLDDEIVPKLVKLDAAVYLRGRDISRGTGERSAWSCHK